MVQHSVSKQMIQLFNSTIKFKAHCEYIYGEPSSFLTYQKSVQYHIVTGVALSYVTISEKCCSLYFKGKNGSF